MLRMVSRKGILQLTKYVFHYRMKNVQLLLLCLKIIFGEDIIYCFIYYNYLYAAFLYDLK